MTTAAFDLVVIGGGITGAGIARDAALRGLKVALFEKNDYASGTSSKSSKLVHGGLRYLQTFDLGLVREALLERQRRFAAQPDGAVLDGRDIGTVIAPDAEVKLFVKATPMIRAQRRHLELRKQGVLTSLDKVLADIRARDERDAKRKDAPMVQAPGAVLLDTSFLSIDAAVQRATALVEAKRAEAAAAS